MTKKKKIWYSYQQPSCTAIKCTSYKVVGGKRIREKRRKMSVQKSFQELSYAFLVGNVGRKEFVITVACI